MSKMDPRETGIDRVLRHSMAAPVPILPADFDNPVMRELRRSSLPLHRYRRILLTSYGLTSVLASAAAMRGQGLDWGAMSAMILGPLALLAVVPWARIAKWSGYCMPPARVILLPLALALTTLLIAQENVSFSTADGGRVCADLYGKGERAVVLAHGGRFNKESWRDQARFLVSKGFQVLAIDFRGFGCSTGPGQTDFDHAPFYEDVLAAVRYLKTHGARKVSIVGGSFGGSAAGDASIKSEPGEIGRVVILGAAPNLPAEKLQSQTLFIVARDDTSGSGPRLPGIRAQYEKAPQPKQLIVLEGSAHAQYLFQTNQGDYVMHEILRFLSMP